MTTETYRGVRIRIVKGKGNYWGYTLARVNGHDQGRRIGTDEQEHLANLRATIDHAQAEPDRYSAEWQAGHKGTRDATCWQGHRCAS